MRKKEIERERETVRECVREKAIDVERGQDITQGGKNRVLPGQKMSTLAQNRTN